MAGYIGQRKPGGKTPIWEVIQLQTLVQESWDVPFRNVYCSGILLFPSSDPGILIVTVERISTVTTIKC
jgi:hypothetical protein